MTKEEYEKLLKSDYWKGFSYSLIKERNFTCEDCGRTFYNERNKLQVHHLVYRDIAPWSYKPEELVVLCEDCHKKRHGITTGSENTGYSKITFDKDTKVVTSSDVYKDYNQSTKRINFNIRGKIRYALIAGLILLVIWGISIMPVPQNNSYIKEPTQIDKPLPSAEPKVSPEYKPSLPSKKVNVPEQNITIPDVDDYSFPNQKEDVRPSNRESRELSTMELLEKRQHEDVVRQARRAGVSSEGSTIEILDRIQHADVVKQAKRAGVSAEGSTIEILDRIQHADVVKQAKRAGVSSEGSTIEILDRIQHADVVKQAKRAGVSTEGTTIEILDRIQHADVVKQAKRLGVSTEGSTMEILDRIQRKELERYNY